MKNLAHSYIQIEINKLTNLYKKCYEVIQNKTYPKCSFEYDMYKQLLKQSETALRELKIIKASIISTYQKYNISQEYLYKEVEKDVKKVIENVGKINIFYR